nr:MAG TPA: hypothetical protein [Bacteriophage sp.]
MRGSGTRSTTNGPGQRGPAPHRKTERKWVF